VRQELPGHAQIDDSVDCGFSGDDCHVPSMQASVIVTSPNGGVGAEVSRNKIPQCVLNDGREDMAGVCGQKRVGQP
jgi:hypothetical protein